MESKAGTLKQDWMDRLGATIADLQSSNDISEATTDALSDCVLEITNTLKHPDYDDLWARRLLPGHLRTVFHSDEEEQPALLIICHIETTKEQMIEGESKKQFLLTSIDNGDVCRDFKKLIADLDILFKDDSEGEVKFYVEIALERADWPLSLYSKGVTLEQLLRLAEYTQKARAVEPARAKSNAFSLCEYEKLSLDFRLTDDGDKAFNFEMVRGHRDTHEIYFNTFGPLCTTFNRDGYSFPLKGDHKGEVRETITLLDKGELLFFGHKDQKAFELTWHRVEGQFEAEFLIYNAQGDVVQTLSILE